MFLGCFRHIIQVPSSGTPPYPRGHYIKVRGPLASTFQVPLFNGLFPCICIFNGHSSGTPPYPRGHYKKGPTCEYLYLMPRYRGIQVGPLPRGRGPLASTAQIQGALKVLEGTRRYSQVGPFPSLCIWTPRVG